MAYRCSPDQISGCRGKCRRLLLQGLFDPAILLPLLKNMGYSRCWRALAAGSWPVSRGALSTSFGPYHTVPVAMTALIARPIQLRHGCSVRWLATERVCCRPHVALLMILRCH